MYPSVSQLGKIENQSQAIKLYNQKIEISVIARRLKVATKTVYKYLNEAGIYPYVQQKRTSTKYRIGEEDKTLRDWCEQYSAIPSIVRSRLYRGSNLLDALTKPVSFTKKHSS